MKRSLFIIALFLFTLQAAKASHLMAGNISYRWLNGNNYEITLTVYRDCGGVPMGYPTGTILDSLGTATATFGGTQWQNFSAVNYFLCPTYTTSTTCYGGTNFGVEKYTFVYNVVLTPNKYTIWLDDCCRNAAVTNVPTPDVDGARFHATIDIRNNSINSSAALIGESAQFLEVGQTYQLNLGGVDPDGDQLTYHFAYPSDSQTGTDIQFATPYTVTNPFSSSVPITLDSMTGVLTFNMNLQSVNLLTIEIREHRDGKVVGSVFRDIQIASLPPDGNQRPSITGINGSNNYTINACANSVVNFVLTASDPDNGQVATMVWDSTIAGATFSSSSGTTANATFNWATTVNDISSVPHVFTAYAMDDYCPYRGTVAANYYINVIACSDTVWPGDANADRRVDLADYLAFGIAYGDTGAQRQNASPNFIGQYCQDWTYWFADSVNVKHADCNGDGVVDMNDTTSIGLYMGQVHYRMAGTHRNGAGQPQSGGAQIMVQLPTLNLDPNTVYSAPVKIGNAVNPVSIYGVDFTIDLPSNLVQPGYTGFTFSSSFLAGQLNRVQTGIQGVSAVSTRLNHANANGYGTIGTLTFKTVSTVIGNQPFNVQSMVVAANDQAGNNLTINAGLVNANISSSVGIQNYGKLLLTVFPNPTSDELKISNAAGAVLAGEMYNVQGTRIQTFQLQEGVNKISVASMDEGVYILKVKDANGGEFLRKITVIH